MALFARINYDDINSKQQEIFNFQKASGVLADFGFATYRLTDDWNGADFLAVNFDGETLLRVQLKGRLTFAKKYIGKDLWVCFRYQGLVYLYPHDEFLNEALQLNVIGNTDSWKGDGGTYSFPRLSQAMLSSLERYCLGSELNPPK